MVKKKRIAILGSTGSIGTSTLNVIRKYRDHFDVIALSAHSNSEKLLKQVEEFSPELVCLTQPDAHKKTEDKLEIPCLGGQDGLCEIASRDDIDLLVSAIVGSPGLNATYRALETGTDVALANKETLIMAGHLIMPLAQKNKAALLPIDSEPSAIFQCIQGHPSKNIASITLTASGGPFRNRPADTFKDITLAEALKHPTWTMGQKITIDSATLMNKGLETIEAHHLFQLPKEKIKAIIHAQSIIHSLVSFKDGSTLAQLSYTSMEAPISYTLFYPERGNDVIPQLNLAEIANLSFADVEQEKFPCYTMARECIGQKPSYAIALNAANECAVEQFLAGKIHFTQIGECIERVLNQHQAQDAASLSEIVEIHQRSMEESMAMLKNTML